MEQYCDGGLIDTDTPNTSNLRAPNQPTGSTNLRAPCQPTGSKSAYGLHCALESSGPLGGLSGIVLRPNPKDPQAAPPPKAVSVSVKNTDGLFCLLPPCVQFGGLLLIGSHLSTWAAGETPCGRLSRCPGRRSPWRSCWNWLLSSPDPARAPEQQHPPHCSLRAPHDGGSPAPEPPRATALFASSVAGALAGWRCSRFALCSALPQLDPRSISLLMRQGRRGRGFGLSPPACRAKGSHRSPAARDASVCRPVAAAAPPKAVSARGWALPSLRSGTAFSSLGVKPSPQRAFLSAGAYRCPLTAGWGLRVV